jgi:hypothetical protein
MVLYACMCVHCFLASVRIAQFDPSRRISHNYVVDEDGLAHIWIIVVS